MATYTESNILPDSVDIVPNRLAHDFWVKRVIDENNAVQYGTNTSRVVFEYAVSKDDTTSNISFNGDVDVFSPSGATYSTGYSMVSRDPREDGYNVYGSFPIYITDKFLPEVNWIDRVNTGSKDHMGMRMVITPQMVHFNGDIFYIEYNKDGPAVYSRKYGKIKQLNDGLYVCTDLSISNENSATMYAQVESMVKVRNSLRIKMNNGLIYNIDKDLRISITNEDRKYHNTVIDDRRLCSVFEGNLRPDLRGLDYKLLYYDEETSTGVGVEDKNDRVVLINYNNRELSDYNFIHFPDPLLHGSIFTNTSSCTAYIEGNYLLFRDTVLGFTLMSIDRDNNNLTLVQRIGPPEITMEPGLTASFVVHDDDVYIPNGKHIYRLQFKPTLEFQDIKSKYTIKQLYDYNGVILGICQDLFQDNDEYVSEITTVNIMNVGDLDKKIYLVQYLDDDSTICYYSEREVSMNTLTESPIDISPTGSRDDIPVVMFPVSDCMSIELYQEGNNGISGFNVDNNAKLNVNGKEFKLMHGGGVPVLPIHTYLKTISGYPCVVKNGLQTRIDSVITFRDDKAGSTMSIDINSIKSSDHLNISTNKDEVDNVVAVKPVFAEKEGLIRDFESDNLYMVSQFLGNYCVVYDKYTDRKRVDINVKDIKTSDAFKVIETDRYVVKIGKDIDPKLSMYLNRLQASDFDRVCANVFCD